VHLCGDTPPATTCVPGCARWPSGRHRLRLARGRNCQRSGERRVYLDSASPRPESGSSSST
jgi:hypothetical protein